MLTRPTHTYPTGDVYSVTLAVSGPSGSSTLTCTNLITADNPVKADFVGQPRSGLPPLTVVFTNTTAGDHVDGLWSFGDGGTSTMWASTHTYAVVRVYTVALTASGPSGTHKETKAA